MASLMKVAFIRRLYFGGLSKSLGGDSTVWSFKVGRCSVMPKGLAQRISVARTTPRLERVSRRVYSLKFGHQAPVPSQQLLRTPRTGAIKTPVLSEGFPLKQFCAQRSEFRQEFAMFPQDGKTNPKCRKHGG